jgi:hypothetical protein
MGRMNVDGSRFLVTQNPEFIVFGHALDSILPVRLDTFSRAESSTRVEEAAASFPVLSPSDQARVAFALCGVKMTDRNPIPELPAELRARRRRKTCPPWVSSMLATLTKGRFSPQGWMFETKFDGGNGAWHCDAGPRCSCGRAIINS